MVDVEILVNKDVENQTKPYKNRSGHGNQDKS